MKKEHPFVVKLRCQILKNNPKEPFMSIVNTLVLESNRQIKIDFDGGDLSSDAGLLLIKEFISKLGIDKLLDKTFKTNDPVFKSIRAMVIIRLSVMTE